MTDKHIKNLKPPMEIRGLRAPQAILLVLLLTACTTEEGHLPGADFGAPITTRDPKMLVAYLINPAIPELSRKEADTLLLQTQANAYPPRLVALEQIIANSSDPESLRIYALHQLAVADASRASRILDQNLPRFNASLLDHACNVALSLEDQRAIDPLIRSLANAMNNQPHPSENPWRTQRPEWNAIDKLGPGSWKDTLFAVVAYNGPAKRRATRIAALNILGDETSPQIILERLRSDPTLASNDSWLADVQWWIEQFGSLPFGDNESKWIAELHKPHQAPLLARAIANHKILSVQNNYQSAPRFINLLANGDLSLIQLPPADFWNNLTRQLNTLPHVRRTPEYAGSPDDREETLDASRKLLTLCDLLAIQSLLTSLQNLATLREIRRLLGNLDLADTTTEHGGLLTLSENATLQITPYAPLMEHNDYEYISSDKLLHDTATALAQFHFHFQSKNNAERAGPGIGDLRYALNTRCNCVVNTSIDKEKIDIDYYTPNGAVVDLGLYTVK